METPATTPDRLSPDGRWRWDGTQWVAAQVPAAATAPAPAPAPAPPRAPATLSPDGQWRWNGAQWVPSGQAAAQVSPAPAQAGGLICQVCGAQPAAEVVMRQHIGMVLWGLRRTFRLVCCRDCGLAFFRQKQNRTLLTGWWGWISLGFYNPWAIISNVIERGRVMSLPAPVRPGGRAPVDPGRPVYLRSGMILSCVLGAVALALIVLSLVSQG